MSQATDDGSAIQQDQPELVVAAIHALVRMVRAR